MAWLTFQCVVLFLTGSASAFLLTASITEIDPEVQESLNLRCALDNSRSGIATTSVISIQKEYEKGSWLNIASVTHNSDDQANNSSVVIGQTGNVNESYLEISWDKPSKKNAGTFRCEVKGRDQRQRHVKEVSDLFTISALNSERLPELERDLRHFQVEYDRFKKDSEIKVTKLRQRIDEARNTLENLRNRPPPECDLRAELMDQLEEEVKENVVDLAVNHTQYLITSSADSCNCKGRTSGPTVALTTEGGNQENLGTTETIQQTTKRDREITTTTVKLTTETTVVSTKTPRMVTQSPTEKYSMEVKARIKIFPKMGVSVHWNVHIPPGGRIDHFVCWNGGLGLPFAQKQTFKSSERNGFFHYSGFNSGHTVSCEVRDKDNKVLARDETNARVF